MRLNSTGSSAVEIFSVTWLSSARAEYRVVVLPLPVGAVMSRCSPCTTRLRGWDQNGIPRKETLESLGLKEVAEEIG
jgi:hypothetical protein